MNISWCLARDYFSLEFDQPVRALSSSILNGGLQNISSFLNLRVDENYKGRRTDFPPPHITISETVRSLGLTEPAAGMMTAASMDSFQYSSSSLGEIDVYCYLTAGLSNALAAGDPGDFMPQKIYSNIESSPLGTINIAAGVSCKLSAAALTEMMIVVTEAKSSVINELGVKSTVSDRCATGTGTDSALVFCSVDGSTRAGEEAFCGKHTVLGEHIASVVRSALFESLKGDKLFI